MNKEFVLNTIRECDSWKEGQCVMFRHTTFYGSEYHAEEWRYVGG